MTAVMLSLAMVAACALQVGAAGTTVNSIKLTAAGGTEVQFTDMKGITFNEKLVAAYKKAYGDVTVAEDSVTIKPTDDIIDAGFCFGVKSVSESNIALTSPNVDEESNELLNALISEDETKSTPTCTYYNVNYLSTLETTDTNGVLELNFSATAAPHKITYRTEGNGFTVKDPDTVENSGMLEFTVTVRADKDSQGYVPDVYDGMGYVKWQDTPTAGSGSAKIYKYKIDSVTSDKEIQISLVRQQCKVVFDKEGSTGLGQSYTTTAGDTSIDYGTDYSFVVTPTDGYSAGDITVTVTKEDGSQELEEGKFVQSGNNCLVKAVTENIKITIEGPTEGAQREITFYAPKGAGYSFKEDKDDDDEGAQVLTTKKVNYGDKYEFRLVVDNEYKNSIENMVVTANGTTLVPQPVGSNPNARKYTISNITTDITVSVAGVTKNKYKVTTKDGAWGTFTTTGSTTVEHGGNFTFKLNVQPAYQSKFSTGDGGEQYIKVTIGQGTAESNQPTYDKATKTYTVTGITDETTIEVTDVDPDKYSATDETGAPAKTTYEITDLNPSGAKNIEYNGSCTFTVKPKVGYRIDTVTYTMGGGGRVVLNPVSKASDGSEATYTVNNITGDVKITVATAKVRYSITFIDPKGAAGGVTKDYYIGDDLAGDIYVDQIDTQNGTITFKSDITPASPYYTFEYWIGNGSTATPTDLKFTHQDQAITLTAKLRLKINDLFDLNITKQNIVKDTVSGDECLRLWLSAVWKAKPQFADLGVNMRIENCGFLYSTGETDIKSYFDEKQLQRLLKKRADLNGDFQDSAWRDMMLVLISKTNKLYAYNFNIGSKGMNADVFSMPEGQFSWDVGGLQSGDKRRVRAYVELVIEEEHYYILSDEIEVSFGS